MEIAWQNLRWYWRFYVDYAIDFWNTLTPMGYGSILIAVAIFGWLLMRGTLKKA